jgi:hypothetical protein
MRGLQEEGEARRPGWGPEGGIVQEVATADGVLHGAKVFVGVCQACAGCGEERANDESRAGEEAKVLAHARRRRREVGAEASSERASRLANVAVGGAIAEQLVHGVCRSGGGRGRGSLASAAAGAAAAGGLRNAVGGRSSARGSCSGGLRRRAGSSE